MSIYPWEELQSSIYRQPNTENYEDFASIEARCVCAANIGLHACGIVVYPLIYGISAVTFTVGGIMDNDPDVVYQGLCFLVSVVLSPVGQVIQLIKAIFGLIHPAAYYCAAPDEPDYSNFNVWPQNPVVQPQPGVTLQGDALKIHTFFQYLADEAKKVGADFVLENALRNAVTPILNKLQYDPREQFYLTEYVRDLGIICEKFKDVDFPEDKKLALLQLLSPGYDGKDGVGACAPGLGQILKSIACSIDVPTDPTQIGLWLSTQFVLGIANKMAALATKAPSYALERTWFDAAKACGYHETNRAHGLIRTLASEITFMPDVLARAQADHHAHEVYFVDKEMILKRFRQFYDKAEFLTFLKEKINESTQEDSIDEGLQKFREHIKTQLLMAKTEELMKGVPEEPEDAYNEKLTKAPVDALAFCNEHYFVKTKKSVDDPNLTNEGIEAFFATLPSNPFDEFSRMPELLDII